MWARRWVAGILSGLYSRPWLRLLLRLLRLLVLVVLVALVLVVLVVLVALVLVVLVVLVVRVAPALVRQCLRQPTRTVRTCLVGLPWLTRQALLQAGRTCPAVLPVRGRVFIGVCGLLLHAG